MTNPYGPWATAIDPGRNPQLSAFWRQRLTMLVPTSQTSPLLSSRNFLGLVAAAMLVYALPTFYAVAAVAQQQPAPLGTHTAAANRTLAAELIQKLYLSRAWIEEARSFRIRSEYNFPPSAADLPKEKQGTGNDTYSSKSDPKISSINDEWAWDRSHILWRTQNRFEGDTDSNWRITEVWDGSSGVIDDRNDKDQSYSFGNKASQFFAPAERGLFPWGPGDGYNVWWSPLDVQKFREKSCIAPDDFELAGQEAVQGRRCYVLQSRAGLIRQYVGAEDGHLYRQENLLPHEGKAGLLAICRKIAGPSINSLDAWWDWLKIQRPMDHKRAYRAFNAAQFDSARVWCRTTFEDYREVAPGCWLSFRQGIDLYETNATKPFLSVHAEQIVVDVVVNKPLPQDLFRVELAEGVKVVDDRRYDPPISYTYRKNQTEAERVALCDAERATQAKLRDSVKKGEASP